MLHTIWGYGLHKFDGKVYYYRVKKKVNPLNITVSGVSLRRITVNQFIALRKTKGFVNLQKDIKDNFD